MMKPKPRPSPRTVFADLGFSPVEAENLKVRAELMVALTKLIQSRGLTQSAAAQLFGVSQPRVSDPVRGKIDRFSVDMLIAMLGAAGAHVTVIVRRARASA
ncbi:MAG: XRE family transcriptional regulator [Gemmatimonadaceae bacterium]|nr:XRE family transcriptional regulator [Gemmatimonadaceae bacterium]